MNINDNVTVILTDYGKQILDEYRTNLEKEIKINLDSIYHYEEDGKFREQLWAIMNIFGSHLYCGSKQIFLDNQIQIEES